jgi:hypothetical protein
LLAKLAHRNHVNDVHLVAVAAVDATTTAVAGNSLTN